MNPAKADFNELIKLYRSGDYGTIFDSLIINLPESYNILANKKKMDAVFSALHEKLKSAKVNYEGHEAYFYDQIIDLLQPKKKLPTDFQDIVKYLLDKCNIEQKDINFSGVRDNNTLFPKDCLNHRIYLSRWGAYLLCENIAKESGSISIDNDLYEDLFVPIDAPKKKNYDPKKKNHGIINDLHTLFAKYFFAMKPDASTDEIANFVKRFIHSDWNCKALNNAENKLKYIYMNTLRSPKDFNISNFNQFMYEFILDTLFASYQKTEDFETIYKKHLESLGYTQHRKYMIKNGTRAPERALGFFSIHIQFLFTKVILEFLKFARIEIEGKSDKITILRNFAKTYFNVIRKATQSPFAKPIFASEPTKDSRGYVTALKNGKDTADRETGEILFENMGELNIYKKQSLFNDSYIEYFKDIKKTEIEINDLHKKWEKQPTQELADAIIKAEELAIEFRYAIYGFNFQGFSVAPLFLMPNGTLASRPLIGANIIQQIYNIPKAAVKTHEEVKPATADLPVPLFEQYKIDFNNPNLYKTIKPSETKPNIKIIEPDYKNKNFIDFNETNSYFTGDILINFLESFLPGGKLHGKEYSRASLYPDDNDTGDSFSYNTKTGKFSDFAAGQSGQGVISLVMFAKDLNRRDNEDLKIAAKFLSDWANKPFNTETYYSPIQRIKEVKPAEYYTPPAGTPAPTEIYYKGSYVKPVAVWPFADKNGIPITYDCRINLPNGKKDILPMKWGEWDGEFKWINGAIPNFRPLYNLNLLKNYEIVYIGEGAKTADAIQFYIGNKGCASTWQGGTNAVEKTDWTQIKNKRLVVIIPDADKQYAKIDIPKRGIKKGDLLPWDLQPGQKAALEIAKTLTPYNKRIVIINTEEMSNIKSGWDIDDAKENNWSEKKLFDFMRKNAEVYSLNAQICYQKTYS